MSIGRLVAMFVIPVAVAFAGPSLTTIQDTLYKADGTPMNGTATITWTSFSAADSSNVGQQQLIVPIVNGSIYVQLVPDTTAIPAAPYTVTYSSDGLIQFQEIWLVPPSVAPLRVSQVRISSTTTVTGGGSTTGGSGSGSLTGSGSVTGTIGESNVTGLSADLAIRPVKGSAFSTGRVALVDTTGAISSVVGNPTDCVYAGGTTGPCFDSTQLPGYSDAETPSGVVDGVNAQFVLAHTPVPTGSLVLVRNGIVQKQNLDYSLTGATVQFLTGAGPTQGDTLIAWYRSGSAASSGSGGGTSSGGGTTGQVIIPTINALVICSSGGSSTTAATLTSLGTCSIPGGYVNAGDRLEIRYIFKHTGTAGGFTYAVKWGATTLVQRTAGINDAMVAGQADASITSGATLLNGQSYGTVLVPLPVLVSASDSTAATITISFQAGTAATSDSASLVDFTVLRYPAISHP